MDSQFSTLNNQYNSKPQDYYGQTRREMQAFIPKGTKTILDIGCSGGAFGGDLKSKNPDLTVWGIEPFEDAATIASGILDKVICNVFGREVVELGNQKFDCITFNDVLEHLINPSQALLDCHNYLEKGGHVVASIPNILYFPVFFNQIIWREDWKYESSGILDNTHLRFFTKKSIIRLFEDSGYEVVKIEGISMGKSKLYRVFNTLLFNKLRNWKYLQFAVVARLRD